MRRPSCNASDTRAVDIRASEDGKIVRRRRECIFYHKRFITYERYDSNNLTVVEKDENREAFDRSKVYHRMKKPCKKRPVPDSMLFEATKKIEVELTHSSERETDSSGVGKLIMEKLKKIGKAVYIRFASVYKEFTGVKSLNEEISKLDSE